MNSYPNKTKNESALKTGFCHFPIGTTFVAIPIHRDEKSYILKKTMDFSSPCSVAAKAFPFSATE